MVSSPLKHQWAFGTFVVVVSLMLLAGCAAVQKMTEPPPVKAQPALNPLGGTPAKFQLDRGGDTSASRCSVWPIRDTYVVQATSQEICVDATLTGASGPTAPSEASTEPGYWGLQADGAKSVALPLKVIESQRKIGVCQADPQKANSQASHIWVSRLKGCAPNNGLLTTTTKELAVTFKALSLSGVIQRPAALLSFK